MTKMITKATTKQITEIRDMLKAGVPAIRKSGSRSMMRETVMRIRQLSGILEVRALRGAL